MTTPRYLVARPPLIEQAIERTRAEIHDPLKVTGMRSHMVSIGPRRSHCESRLAWELRREAERRLSELNERLRFAL